MVNNFRLRKIIYFKPGFSNTSTVIYIFKVKKLEKELGDRFYIEVIYFLTHTLFKSGKQAKQIFNEIKKHHKDLNRKLNRNIGIQVAILDYSMNVSKTLKAPTIIEEAKITEMAHTAITDKMTQAYDKKFLFHDLEKEIEKTRRYGTKFSILMVQFCGHDSFHIAVNCSASFNKSSMTASNSFLSIDIACISPYLSPSGGIQENR